MVIGYNTRNANILRTPFCRTKLRQFSLRFQGPKFKISLPEKITNKASAFIFASRQNNFSLI